MITNEKLRAVVSYTTPGGAQLSWANNADLLIRDTSVPITSEGDIGLYRHHWGSDGGLQQRRVYQTYVGSQIIVSGSGGVTGSSFTRSGFSNGFKWESSNKATPITNNPGGFIVNALLSDTTIIYGDGTNVSQSLRLFITVTRPNNDGVLHNSVTIVFRNLRTNVLHSFTFQRDVSYGTGGTYHENTSQFKDLRARIEAIGEYGDRIEIESVTIT